MPTHPAEIIAAITIALTALLVITRRAGTALPYDKRKSLLTPTELHFKKFLELAMPDTNVIMAQVSLEEIIVVKPTTNNAKRAQARNRIKSKRIDFVLCDRSTMYIECAIELNDRSHQRSDRRARDRFVRMSTPADAHHQSPRDSERA